MENEQPGGTVPVRHTDTTVPTPTTSTYSTSSKAQVTGGEALSRRHSHPHHASAGSQTRKSKNSRRDKANVALPRLLALGAFSAYLVMGLVFLYGGHFSLSNIIHSTMTAGQSKLRTQSTIMGEQILLSSRLEDLLNTDLQGRWNDRYEDCLARGLEQAYQKLFGQAFLFGDVRNEVVDWAESNCKRLLFSPQPLMPTTRQLLHIYMMQAQDRSLAIAAEAFDKTQKLTTGTVLFVKHNAILFWDYFFGTSYTNITEDTSTDIITEPGHISNIHDVPKIHRDLRLDIKLPVDFFSCVDDQPCKLVLPATSELLIPSANITAETAQRSARKLLELFEFSIRVGKTRRFVKASITALAAVQALLVGAIMAAVFMTKPTRQATEATARSIIQRLASPQGPSSLKPEDHAVGMLTLQLLSLQTYSLIALCHEFSSSVALHVGMSSMFAGITLLLGLPVYADQLRVVEALHDLNLIFRGDEVPVLAGGVEQAPISDHADEVESITSASPSSAPLEINEDYVVESDSDIEINIATNTGIAIDTDDETEYNDAKTASIHPDTGSDINETDSDIEEPSVSESETHNDDDVTVELPLNAAPPAVEGDSDWSILDT